MNPLRARYTKIDKLVDSLLSEHNVQAPPIPIGRIVRRLGIELKSGELGEISGFLVRNDGKATIGVNSTHPKVRQRFTVAHECGHYLLHVGISAHYDKDFKVNFRSAESSQATDIEEIEANYFAASILMPAKLLTGEDALT